MPPLPGTHRRALVIVSQVCADGGIQRFNRTLLSACNHLNLQCDVLSLGDSESARGSWTPPGATTVAVFGHNKVKFALKVIATILRGEYDYIIIGHVNLLALVIFATRFKRSGRVLMVAHGIEVWRGLTGLRRAALQRVDLTLCVSHYTRDIIKQQVPKLHDAKLAIFPNALSESWAEQSPAAAFARPLSLPPKYLLTVTRLDRADRYKGVVTVLEALSMVKDPSLRYVIAGIGNDLAFLQRVAERFGVEQRVQFAGAVSDSELASLYRHCVAFVLPSGKEGFGIVFLEAMYFGACVIAARDKGAVDVVRHEETGLLIPFGDAAGLKRSIERLLDDDTLRERLRAAGRATVVGSGQFTFAAYEARLAGLLDLPAPVNNARECVPAEEANTELLRPAVESRR